MWYVETRLFALEPAGRFITGTPVNASVEPEAMQPSTSSPPVSTAIRPEPTPVPPLRPLALNRSVSLTRMTEFSEPIAEQSAELVPPRITSWSTEVGALAVKPVEYLSPEPALGEQVPSVIDRHEV